MPLMWPTRLRHQASRSRESTRAAWSLDCMTILESVSRTGRLAVVNEDYRSFGLSGEIAAKLTDVDPGMLRAPVVRVANPGVPVPYAHSPESAVLPHQKRTDMAIQRVIHR